MSRKDYVAFAAAIKYQLDHGGDRRTLENVAQEMVNIFVADNARFDRARFLEACGL